jgi:hypothetical protein
MASLLIFSQGLGKFWTLSETYLSTLMPKIEPTILEGPIQANSTKWHWVEKLAG